MLHFAYDMEWNSRAYILAGIVAMFCIDFQKEWHNGKIKKNDFAYTQPYNMLSPFRFQRHENRKQQTERNRNIKNMFVQSCYVYKVSLRVL